jgi:arabinose-5-phosphate isomerase
MTVIGDLLTVLVAQMSGYRANDYALRHHRGYLGNKAKGSDIEALDFCI